MHLPPLLLAAPLLAASALGESVASSSSSSSSGPASGSGSGSGAGHAPQRLGKPGSGAAGLGSSSARPFPEDVFAHPPHRLSFDGAPIRNGSAARVVEGEETVASGIPHLFRGPDGAYLCHLPAAQSRAASAPPLSASQLAAERSRALSSGLALLEPLRQQCIYHTLDWFTYEFCHGRSVRQFHALASSALPGRTPVPDPKQDSYVLGRAPATRETTDVAHQRTQGEGGTELMEVVSFSVGEAGRNEDLHGQRYLSQVWGGGTLCAISNEPRSIEVQFHCSRRPGDRISLVKETTTCNYVLIVDTPRLCADSVFAVPEEQVHDIVCRPVVSDTYTSPIASRTAQQLDSGAAAAASSPTVGEAGPSEEADEESGFHTRGDPFSLGGLPDGGGEMWAVDVDEDGQVVMERYDEDFDAPESDFDDQGASSDAEAAGIGGVGDIEVQLLEGDMDPAIRARIQQHINDVAARAAREDAASAQPRSAEERWAMLQEALKEALAKSGIEAVVQERPPPGTTQDRERAMQMARQQEQQQQQKQEARELPRARQGLAAAPAAPAQPVAPPHAQAQQARQAPPPPAPQVQAARPAAPAAAAPPPQQQARAQPQAAAAAANARLEAAIAAALEATKKLRAGGGAVDGADGGAAGGGGAAAAARGTQARTQESLGERAERFWREKKERERKREEL